MRAIFIVSMLALSCLTAPSLLDADNMTGSSALAQRSRQSPSAPQAPAEPERRFPDTRHQSRLDQLFERLAASRDEAEAAALVEQIERIWRRSGSETVDLLMARARETSRPADSIIALDLIDSIIALQPDWAEAYSRRAVVLFQRQDFDGAMRDLRQALALEPRHFQAMAGVGMIFQQGGNNRQALAAFRDALKINPHFKGIRQAAEKLALEQDGQKI